MKGSWAIDSYTGSIGHNGEWKNYAVKLRKKDIVGVFVDLEKGRLSFSVNGKPFGVAFEEIPQNTGISPAVSLKYYSTSVSANFGSEECFCGCGKKFHCPLKNGFFPLDLFDGKKESERAEQKRSENRKNAGIYSLGRNMYSLIALYLKDRDLINFTHVCKAFSDSVNGNCQFWKESFRRKYFEDPSSEDVNRYGGKKVYIARKRQQICQLNQVDVQVCFFKKLDFIPKISTRSKKKGYGREC